MKKTVVELDLIGYSDKARELEENLGAHVVMEFNDQIQEFVDAGLKAAGVDRDDTVFATTGDGAILLFDDPSPAHRFARAVHEYSAEFNLSRTVESAHRWFRMGAATGEVEIRDRDKQMAGITIANAVRLEAAGAAGHFLTDIATWKGLPKDLQDQYRGEEEIAGKRDERISARRCVMVDQANASAKSKTTSSGGQPSRQELRTLLESASHDEILLAAATLELGVASSANKTAAIASILNWATTSERRQQVAVTVNPS